MKPRLFKSRAALDAFLRAHPVGAYHMMILHDGGCSPNRCICKPWFELKELTAENVLEGERSSRAWAKGSAS